MREGQPRDAVEELDGAAGAVAGAAVFGDGVGVGRPNGLAADVLAVVVDDAEERGDGGGEEVGGDEADAGDGGGLDRGDSGRDVGAGHPEGESLDGGIEGVGDVAQGDVGVGEGVEDAVGDEGVGGEGWGREAGHGRKVYGWVLAGSRARGEQVSTQRLVEGNRERSYG